MNFKRTACYLLLSVFFLSLSAQDLSNKGKDFWVAYAGHIDGTTSRMALYITSDQNATGIVDINGNTTSFTVVANQVAIVQLTNTSIPNNSLAYNGQVEGIGAKKGIHITADKLVVVYAHILNAARSGSTLVLPTNVLGKEYYVSSYKSTTSGSVRRSQVDVIATVDNTNITTHYLNIIFKTSAFSSLRIDGAAPTAIPRPIPGTGYSYIQQDVTTSTNTNMKCR